MRAVVSYCVEFALIFRNKDLILVLGANLKLLHLSILQLTRKINLDVNVVALVSTFSLGNLGVKK